MSHSAAYGDMNPSDCLVQPAAWVGKTSGTQTYDPRPEGIVTTVGTPAASDRAKSRGQQDAR